MDLDYEPTVDVQAVMLATESKDTEKDSDVKFMTFLRKNKLQPTYQVPELHNNIPYKAPDSAPASIDTFHKKKPLLALGALFGLKPPTSRKGSSSSASSAADSNAAPSTESAPPVTPSNPSEDPPELLTPQAHTRPRTSSLPSTQNPSIIQPTQGPLINPVSHTQRNSNTTPLQPLVSAPTKKHSLPRHSTDHPERPSSSQSHNRSSVATSTLVPRKTHPPVSSRRLAQASIVRDSFASESSTGSGRYHSLALHNPSLKKMSVVDEEGRLVETMLHETSAHPRNPARSHSAIGRTSTHTHSIAHTHATSQSNRSTIHPSTARLSATKHGSFDFERPGWWNSHISAYQTQPIANLGDMRRSVSLRDENHSPRSRPPPDLPTHDPGGSLGRHSGRKSKHANPEPSEDSTTSAAKKSKRSSLRIGIAKLTGGLWSHGRFAFETPVTSPTGPTAPAPLSSKDTPRPSHQGHRSPGLPPSSTSQKATPPTTHSSHLRPARPKGRSLDLGLGLSWAPRTMKESVLLPGSTLGGNSGTSSFNPSTLNPPAEEDVTETDDAERRLIGRDVAAIFRDALDEPGYAAFRDYIHRFDTHAIPFDGPKGIIARVERLLSRHAPGLTRDGQSQLLGTFVRVILHNT